MPSVKPPPLKAGDQVFLVDGSSFVFRAYFQSMNQDRKYNSRSDGLPTGAVRLFCTKLFQFIRDGAVGIKPTHLAIIFDKSEQSFRKEIYADYKAHRPDPPDELIPQFPLMREAVRAFGLLPVEQERYEADDIIAAYARQGADAGAEVLIVSSDKDLMQMVRPGVTFYDFESGIKGKPGYRPERRLDREGVLEKFGVSPEKVPDVQALIGDPTDNVPGVPGIGIKTASQLINEYGDLETLLEKAPEIKQPKRRESLLEYAEQARISKKLVTLDSDMPVTVPLADLKLAELDAKTLIAFLKAMEFTTITKRVAEIYGIDAAAIEPDPRLAGKGPPAAAAPAEAARGETEGPLAGDLTTTPEARADALAAEAAATRLDRSSYAVIRDLGALDAVIAKAEAKGLLALDIATDSTDPMAGEIVSLSLSTAPGEAFYLPLGHRAAADLLAGGGLAEGQLEAETALSRLRPVLEDLGVLKVGHDVKPDLQALARKG
ncbi:MAG: 5'-3' exonuclease H3TH domain-containing protein, partial [Parvibaculaceae bacterium]